MTVVYSVENIYSFLVRPVICTTWFSTSIGAFVKLAISDLFLQKKDCASYSAISSLVSWNITYSPSFTSPRGIFSSYSSA